MKRYLSAFRARALTVSRYKSAALAGMFAQGTFGLILVMIVESWYLTPGATESGMSLSQAASYIWLGQAFFALLPWNPDPELRDIIRSGEIVRDLIRPLDLYWLWFWRSLAWRATNAVLRAPAIFILAVAALPALGLSGMSLGAPASPAALATFIILMVPSAFMSAAITVFLSCFQFSQVSSAGVTAVFTALISFLSGLTVPLPLMGGLLDRIANFLPFRAMSDIPFRFWSGHLAARALWFYLPVQLAWLALTVAGGKLFLSSRLKKLSIAGA